MRISIEEYIEAEGQVETTRLARLIILGNGGAGKTSLVNKLCNPKKKLAMNENPTPRIQIRELMILPSEMADVENGEKDAREETALTIWDFGGQVIMHSTHSFFLSELSTYIIACNSRANEQPDAWLRLLTSRLPAQKRMTVLVVYTHCDQKQLGNARTAPWRRDNALKRAFPALHLNFYNIDLQPGKTGDAPGLASLVKTIKARAFEEGKKPVDSDILAIRDYSKKLEASKTPYISHKELHEKLKDKLREDVSQAFRLANSYGYIFPQAPVKVGEEISDDSFIWVSQKHWLTFGVYSLINNNKVIEKSGLLTDEMIDEALCLDEQRHINAKGEIKTRRSKNSEAILYDVAGREVLKIILLNYRWALMLNKRAGELLLPLSTPLDEPAGFANIVRDFDRAEQALEKGDENIIPESVLPEESQQQAQETEQQLEYKSLYIEVELNNQPADFFFKLVTYLDSHLSEPWYLWRTGAILDFYGNQDTRAIIEMPDNVLSLRVMGKNKVNFQQLLLICVRETIDSYKSRSISAHSYERIWINDKRSQILSSEIIDNLTSGTTIVDKLVKQKLKGAVSMTTINITGDVHKSNIAGEHNQMTNEGDIQINYTQLNEQSTELVVQLKQLVDKLPDDKQNEIAQINESIGQIEKGIAENDKDKKKSLIRLGLDGVKDLVVIDKGLDLLTEYPALGAAVTTGVTALTQLLAGAPVS